MLLRDLSTLLLVLAVLFWIWELFFSSSRKTHPSLSVRKGRYREPNGGLSGLSPYFEVEKTTGVVIQKEGLLQKTYAFRGPDLSAASDDHINAFEAHVNRVLMRKGTGWTWHFEAQKMTDRGYQQSSFQTYAERVVEEERSQHFQTDQRFFTSSYYITIVYAPPVEINSKAKEFWRHPDKYVGLEREIEVFVREADTLISELTAANWFQVDTLTADEVVSYLHTAFSWNWFPMRAPQAFCYLDAVLFDADVSIEGDDILKIGNHLTKVISLYTFPSAVIPGILEGLNRLGVTYRWTTRWMCLDTDEANKRIDVHRKRFFGERKSLKDSLSNTGGSGMVNMAAMTKYEEANMAQVELQQGISAYGLLTTCIQVEQEIDGDDIQSAVLSLRAKADAVVRIVNASGFSAKVETGHLLEAWRSMQPGNVYANVRRQLFGSNQTTCILPITAPWAGRPYNEQGEKVGGNATPTTICATEGTSRFNLNLNVLDVWHFLVVGSTGSGKTTLLALLLLSVGKYISPITKKRARRIFIDYDYSIRQLGMAMGAMRYHPGIAGGLGFQPLRRLESSEDIAWAHGFIEILLKVQDIPTNPRMRTAITEALKQLSSSPPEKRRMGLFKETIQYEEEGVRVFDDYLSAYVNGGPYGAIFDTSEPAPDLEGFTIFEMKSLMEMGLLVSLPALKYIFRQVELSLDGTLTYVFLDEAWRYFKEDYAVEEVMAFLKAGRKNNLGVGLCTQDIAEVHRRQDLASSLRVNCPIQFFLPNPGALAISEVYQAFGLTHDQIVTVAEATKQRDYLYSSEEGVKLFQLDLGPRTKNISVAYSNREGRPVLDSLEGKTPDEITEYFLTNGRFK